MDDIFKQLKKAQGVKMTDAERARIRTTLLKFSGGTPSPYVRPSSYGTTSPFGIGFFAKVVAFALVGFIAGGTTLSFASAKALPGDQLYAMKTNVVEKIGDTFTFGVEAKARAQAQHVATRISEIASLKASGRINDQSRSEAAQMAFNASFASYTDAVTKLRNIGRVARSNEIALATLTTVKTIAPTQPALSQTAMPMMAKSAATFSAGSPTTSVVDTSTETSLISDLDASLLSAVTSIEVFTSPTTPVQNETSPNASVQTTTSVNPTATPQTSEPKPGTTTPILDQTPKIPVTTPAPDPTPETPKQEVTNPRIK